MIMESKVQTISCQMDTVPTQADRHRAAQHSPHVDASKLVLRKRRQLAHLFRLGHVAGAALCGCVHGGVRRLEALVAAA